MSYRVVILFQDAELAEGFGSTRQEALDDAMGQVGAYYTLRADFTYRTYRESF